MIIDSNKLELFYLFYNYKSVFQEDSSENVFEKGLMDIIIENYKGEHDNYLNSKLMGEVLSYTIDELDTPTTLQNLAIESQDSMYLNWGESHSFSENLK